MIVPKALRFYTKVAIVSCAVALSATVPSFADTYRWTDKNGVIGYADSLQKIPPQYRDSAKRTDRDSPAGSATKPFQVVPSLPQSNVGAPPRDMEENFGGWRDRMREAREDLEQLRSQREAAQKEYDTLRGEGYGKIFADPEADIKHRARLAELDEQINQKEYELTTTIPDDARKAGVPPGILNQ